MSQKPLSPSVSLSPTPILSLYLSLIMLHSLCRPISWTRTSETKSPIFVPFGDILSFVFLPGSNNVYWMPDKVAFDQCDFNKAKLISIFFLPPAYFPLTPALNVGVGDTLYFASRYGNNCKKYDLKVVVHVVDRDN